MEKMRFRSLKFSAVFEINIVDSDKKVEMEQIRKKESTFKMSKVYINFLQLLF